jgi:pimeloyl-ACP methyl ester carboxylesterase
MKSKNIVSYLKLSSLITIFSLLNLVACGGCGSTPLRPKGKGGNKPVAKKLVNNPSNLKKVIILLHGLNSPDDSGIAAIRNKLMSDMKNTVVMALKRKNSGSVSTAHQGQEAYITLKKELSKGGLIKNPVYLIGDSHGGLVALELYRQHKDDLNIAGIITNHSPLEGAPGINAKQSDVEELKKILNKFKPFLDNAGVSMDLSKINPKDIITNHVEKPVIEDLTKGSGLLTNIETTLRDIHVPVLLLAGKVTSLEVGLSALIEFSTEQNVSGLLNLAFLLAPGLKTDLDKIFTAIIGAQEHDAFIPLYSQMAQHTSVSSMVKRSPHDDYHHFYGMANHQKVYNEIVSFINQPVSQAKK